MMLLSMALALLLLQPSSSTAFISIYPSTMESSFFHHSSLTMLSHHRGVRPQFLSPRKSFILSSTWDDFAYDDNLDDDDAPLLDSLAGGDTVDFVPADENDDPSIKVAAGMALQPPNVQYDGPVIDVPQGSTLELDEDIVQGVLAACRQEIGTMFGYQAENRGVGITGGVDFVELDGPTVVLHLKGRFWHQRTTVLKRVGAYLMARIPEIVDVVVADEYELTDEANNNAT